MKPMSIAHRNINATQLLLAQNCLHGALATPERAEATEQKRSPSVVTVRLLSTAAHDLVAGEDPRRVLDSLRQKAPERSENDLMRVIHKAGIVADRVAHRRRRKGKIDPKGQNLMSWQDHMSGWEVFGEPHRMQTKEDEQGEFIEVTMYKFAARVRDRYIKLIRLIGMVAYMERHQQTQQPDIRVKLVIECMKSPARYTEWLDDCVKVGEMLADARVTLGRLVDAANAREKEGRVPPRTPGEHCFGCPLQGGCRQGDRFINRLMGKQMNGQPAPATALTEPAVAGVRRYLDMRPTAHPHRSNDNGERRVVHQRGRVA